MYPELGLRFTPAEGGPPNDMLISFSCNQVAAVAGSFVWPHPAAGMTSDMVKKLSELVPQIFPAGGAPPAPAPGGVQYSGQVGG
jgi:hypothetical protein